MKVALFVPCYVDQFYPKVAIASLELLNKFGVDVHYPPGQTCCGQPMANSGFEHLTQGTDEHFVKTFNGYDYIVSPSGSCVLHIKEHLSRESVPMPRAFGVRFLNLRSFLPTSLRSIHLMQGFHIGWVCIRVATDNEVWDCHRCLSWSRHHFQKASHC